jgi:phage tail sheath protein FI
MSMTLSSQTPPKGTEVADAWSTWKTTNDAAGFNILKNGDGGVTITTATPSLAASKVSSQTLKDLQTTNTALYSKVRLALNEQRVVLPPSPAIAGIYARVDRERGVWKTPANVSLASVIGPVSKISSDDQEGLNIDPTGGKSVNAIRDFTGKGTLVWGGRTLAGNDNEWRYVSVRRLFITIEESARKATSFAVFEPNDATTWLKVKAMIESYLYGLWEQGALAGPKPESAYFVNVGLGKTMTAQDILEGQMIVEIGIAAVRPAEFIILRFTHKLQEA